MEPAVTAVLSGVLYRTTARDDLGNSRVRARFQGEVKDRFSGFDRSPQQAESLAAAGDSF